MPASRLRRRIAGTGARRQQGDWQRPRPVPAIGFDVARSGTLAHDVKAALRRRIGEFKSAAIAAVGRDRVHWVDTGDGGYLLFLARSWQADLLVQVRNLLQWAAQGGTPVRVALHYGTVQLIRDEDGTGQTGSLLDSIEWFLTRGSEAGIVASEQFREALGDQPGAEFHDTRQLRLKHGQPVVLHLMSLPGTGQRSQWSPAVAEDYRLLLEAGARHSGFDSVYYGKRLLQVNSEDPIVAQALARLDPLAFAYETDHGRKTVNELLGNVGPTNLRRLVQLGQLVERRYNEVLCRRGDAGSAMFVILRGQVGVYNGTEDGDAAEPARPLATHSEGEIVGELAFALNRPRTADLVCLGDTALLAFEWEQVERLLKSKGERYHELVTARALEHVSQRVPFLIGRPLPTLSETERREWMGWLSILQQGCEILHCRPHKSISLSDLRRRCQTKTGGVFILASGHLQSQATAEKRLDGAEFPLLYVDLPDLAVAPDHEYVADHGPAKVIFIRRDAINALPQPAHARLVRELRLAMRSLYRYDVFLAHSFDDAAIVEQWEQELEALGLTVFRDSPKPFGEPWDQKDGRALLDSLVTLVFVSPYVTPTSVAMQEKAFRERHFARNPRIAPVALPGGDPRRLGIMYPPVRTAHEVASLVRAIRDGVEEPPYGLTRQSGARIT
ncbi:MAG TPA: cyclic nucleotide-binding domain-containing protein [Candidatus Dormibacteraeota bacterium]|nr:cyclic nucleotide-binding domain-containing protein [Candidatus Dormibacteraeota bacterium]